MAKHTNSPSDFRIPTNLNINIDKSKVKAVLALLIVGVAIATSVYTIPAESIGVILRFGKAIKEVTPGIHLKLPYGVDQMIPVPVKRQLKQEFGFSTRGATDPTQQSIDPERETLMVTGDLNSALVQWIIQYRIVRPTEYLFNVRGAGETLRDVSESVMREVVGDRTVDEVITIGRQEIEAESLRKMQEVVNKYALGLQIDQVQLKDVNPPKPVQSSFDEVNKAQQEREKLINLANGEYNKAVPRARGLAHRAIREAEGYRTKRINEAEGDAALFNALLAEYVKAPKVTKRRLYLETMSEILPLVESKIIIDESTQGILPLLQLDKTGGPVQ
jgi:membrane protease subunit HflK